MNFLRHSTKMIQKTSPAGLLLSGIVLSLGLPLIRKGLRCAAVVTARTIYSLADEARSMKNQSLYSKEAHS